MRIIIRNPFPLAVVLLLAISGCASIDLSTPEKNLGSLYQAIANKDSQSYAECYYAGGSARADQLNLEAQDVFKNVTVIGHTIIQKQEVTSLSANLTVVEISRREDGGTYASTFTVKYIKMGNDWKILSVGDIDTKRINKPE